MTPGITREDRERMGKIRETRRKQGRKRQVPVPAATCADWRARYRAGETIQSGIARETDFHLSTVNRHIYGPCCHDEGER